MSIALGFVARPIKGAMGFVSAEIIKLSFQIEHDAVVLLTERVLQFQNGRVGSDKAEGAS